MGYRVIYDEKSKKQGRSLRFRLIPLTAAAWLSFLLLVNACWPRGQEVLRSMILPEAVNTALESVNTFADTLKSGNLTDALEVFSYALDH